MRHGSLFSGIGGFDLAAEWMGWENVFHCEWNEFGQKILKHYWPNAISYGDITKTDFTIHRGRIDILTGGFPCQPYSMAGKRKGKADERHLWPEMLRAIREIQPSWIVGENVPGIINWSGGLVFHEVQVDLETEWYEVFPVVLPACGVNAPHRRDRIWFVAHSIRRRKRELQTNAKRNNTQKVGCENSYRPEMSISSGITTNTPGNAITGQDGEGIKAERKGTPVDDQGGWGQFTTIQPKGLDDLPRNNTNTKCQGLEGRNCKEMESGNTTRLYKGTNWQNFPTQSPLCSRDDGFSSRLDGITFPKFRNESIKAYGNAIVPQVAYQIFKAINETDLK